MTLTTWQAPLESLLKFLQDALISLARAHQQLLALTLAQLLVITHQQMFALCNLLQMNTEDVSI